MILSSAAIIVFERVSGYVFIAGSNTVTSHRLNNLGVLLISSLVLEPLPLKHLLLS